MHAPLLALIGPTASGKESLALALAPLLDAEILSLDSMKVYRGMDIGTAKASPGARARVPHHLIDFVDPARGFSTREWLTAADAAIEDIRSRGRRPLFSGGTALYLKALLFGLFEGPPADPELRMRLKLRSGDELHRRLADVDPATAEKVHPNDQRRLVRALEVFEITGRPVSELRREWSSRARTDVVVVGLRRERQDLFARIDRRVDLMIDAGLIAEVRALLESPGGLGPIAAQALGYKEIADHLSGAIPDLSDAIDLLKQRTRHFARRQLTWFKHFDVRWIDVAAGDTVEDLLPFALDAVNA